MRTIHTLLGRWCWTILLAAGGCAAGKPLESSLSGSDYVALRLQPHYLAVAPNGSGDFTATAQFSDGSENPATGVRYSATGGTVSASGHYAAGGSPGSYEVVGELGGRVDTALIEITPFADQPIVSIRVSPATAAVQPGGTQQFAAVGLHADATDTVIPITWTATGGTISAAGLFTAPFQTGTYLVIAAQQGGALADTASVTVASTPPNLTAVVVTPASAALQFGQSQQFNVIGQLSGGSTTSVTVTWSATGGSVTQAGLYTANNTAGTFRVIARASNGMADTSSITISAPSIVRLTITPSSAALQTGQAQQFNAAATLSNGGSQANPAVTWTATGGTIGTTGLFVAGTTPGSYQVIARASNGVADTVAGTIAAASINTITVSPGSTTLTAGQNQQFTAVAGLSNGGTQPNPVVLWTATGGTVTSAGLYTAGTSVGTFQVTATQQGGGVSGGASVSVVQAPPSSMFFNSSEPGCGTDPNVVLCDDFEDGSWYEKNCDDANGSGGLLQVDGWCGTIYADPITPAKAAVCGGQGYRSNCAATSGALTGAVGGRNMADHNLGPNNNGYKEIYLRYYIRTSPGYSYGSQKMITFNSTPAGSGGISIGGSGSPFGDGAYDTCPIYDCNTTGAVYYYRQNQGQTLHLSQITGHWAFVEMHVKLNTPGQANGVWELWLNDCGTDGLSCGAAPILRTRYTTVQWQGPSDNKQIMSIWFENWANPGSVGTEYYDQIKVSRVGPIGFMP